VAVTAARVTVSTTAVALIPAEADTASGTTVTLQNQDATNTVSLGPSGVTAGNGYRLQTGAVLTLKVPAGEQIFAIRDGAADVVVSVLRLGV
jgi:hypothetical protein